jgi:hypothetical protein
VDGQTDWPDASRINDINQIEPKVGYSQHGDLIAASIDSEQELMALI